MVWHCWHDPDSNRECADRMFGFYRANFIEEPSEKSLAKTSVRSPYRKPTQVDRASSPRGTSESSLRNSAKKRPYLRYKACPAHLTKPTSCIRYRMHPAALLSCGHMQFNKTAEWVGWVYIFRDCESSVEKNVYPP